MLQLLYTQQGTACIFLYLPSLQPDQPNSFTFLLCRFKSLSDFWRQQSIVYFGGARKVQYQKTDISKTDIRVIVNESSNLSRATIRFSQGFLIIKEADFQSSTLKPAFRCSLIEASLSGLIVVDTLSTAMRLACSMSLRSKANPIPCLRNSL